MNKIITFHMVAKCKSFTRAAESLGLTQPAVSLQIKSLEDECGMELFERVGKNILLTDAGKTLLLYVEKILHTMEEAKRALKEAQDPLSGEIKFGASILSGIYVIPPILGKFKREHPHVTFSVKIRFARDLIESIEDNKIDFAIMGEGDKSQRKQGLSFTSLLEDELVFVTSPMHKLASKKTVSAYEVLNQDLILTEKYSATRNYIDSEFNRYGVCIEPYLELGNIEVVKKLVAEDFGSSILSWISVKREVAEGNLHASKIEEMNLVRRVFLVKRKGKKFLPATNLFLSFLKSETGSITETFVYE